LNSQVGHDGGDDSFDGDGPGNDVQGVDVPRPDLRVDVPVDTRADSPVDVPIDRGGCANGFHLCGTTCVDNTSPSTCGALCAPCMPPANASAACDGVTCGFACNTNLMPQGSSCVPGCSSACDTGATIVALPGSRFPGTTAGSSANVGSCGGAEAPEAVYKLVLTVTSDVFVTTHGTAFDTVVYMRRGCCGAEIACNDDADGRTTSVLAQPALAAGTYYIFVDGATADDAGAFTVDIYTSPTSANPAESCGRPGRISNATITGNSCNYRNDYNHNNQSNAQGVTCANVENSTNDLVYYFVLDDSTRVTFNTCNNTCIDSIIYVRDICTLTATQRVCNDDACSAPGNCISTPAQSQVSVLLEPGVHYLVLDSYPIVPPMPTCGPFTLTPTGVPP
jgi:hypothetical protein